MTKPPKRYRVSNLKLREISSVDHPAQAGARSVLIKSAGATNVTDIEIRKNASAVVGGDKPNFGSDAFEGAMLRRADELAQHHRITPEQALLKGLGEDAALRDLAHACEVAKVAEYGARVRGRGAGVVA